MAQLKAQSLTLTIANKTLCKDLNVEIIENQNWALLGRNGVGKTTLLHSLIGQRTPNSGEVLLDQQSVYGLSPTELARKMGILFQQGMESLPATVFETVMLGRHPHMQSLFWDDAKDVRIAEDALTAFDLTSLRDRSVDSLSGGEQQRLALALLLTQTPEIFLLDEPSNHLDLAFQTKLLSALTRKVSKQSASLLMATHDINLAARFCEHFILLLEGGESLVGTREEILNEENLSMAYGCEIRSIRSADHQLFYPA